MRHILLRTLLVCCILVLLLSACASLDTVEKMEEAIAKELEVPSVTSFAVEDVGNFRFIGYKNENAYSFAVFSKVSDNGWQLEKVFRSDKLLKRGDDIFVAYYRDCWIAVSTNPHLDHVEWTGDFQANVSVDTSPALIVLDQSHYYASVNSPSESFAEYLFYDSDGNIIQ